MTSVADLAFWRSDQNKATIREFRKGSRIVLWSSAALGVLFVSILVPMPFSPAVALSAAAIPFAGVRRVNPQVTRTVLFGKLSTARTILVALCIALVMALFAALVHRGHSSIHGAPPEIRFYFACLLFGEVATFSTLLSAVELLPFAGPGCAWQIHPNIHINWFVFAVATLYGVIFQCVRAVTGSLIASVLGFALGFGLAGYILAVR